MRLRALARSHDDEPQRSLSRPQLTCLRFILARLHKIDLDELASERETMLALARLGGHITSNGDPGWQVLGRGLDGLLSAELGYMAAEGM